EAPKIFSLEQNYPNPFNPGTTISWQTPVSGWQTIKLYDLLGREIETIVEGYYEGGSHSTLYIVNSTLPSGVYFYQLRVGDYIETKKMILLR
ncbi:MAG: T9SS type A sorting domain-containing protein, partial [Ignavibacterium sp.]|nr:T9SS type A sorting domain-containing protein [Ignavibacterium sp.]